MSRKAVWAAVGLLCAAAGIVGALLGAQSVAHTDSVKAQQTFHRTSAAMASTLQLGIRHQEEIATGASTFFAGTPNPVPAEFATWAQWAHALSRHPELERLTLLKLVRASELPVFAARLKGLPIEPTAAARAAAAADGLHVSAAGLHVVPAGLHVFPASEHHYFCLAAAEVSRHAVNAPAGLDYCALTAAPLLSRGSGLSIDTMVSTGHESALVVLSPVYAGHAVPVTEAGRQAAFVGWLRQVLVPAAVLRQALKGHPEAAVRLRYRTGRSKFIFTAGTVQSGAQSATVNLHNGWAARTYGPPATIGVLSDGSALALLLTGIVLSGVLGLLIFSLGTGTATGSGRAAASPAPRPPSEDLYDPVTGLPNRALMLDRAGRMLARAGRQSGMLVGALFIDIDWFQDVTAKLGDGAGDQLLKIVAARLENVIRGHDTVGRLGGDEFVVLVESAARGARLDSLARRVIEAMHKPVELEGFAPSFVMTASIGVAFGRYATTEDMLRDAQLALHAAKAAGRDRYTLFNANMRSVIEGRGVLEVELNTAVQNGQFMLLYDPIYDLATGRVSDLEADIRWCHPTQGVLPPEDFIQLAEEIGLIVPIGRWMLEEACGRAAAWNVAGHRVGVTVKVSPHQMNREGFTTDVLRALQQSGIDPSQLTLAIPETAVMGNIDASAARLTEVKRLGVRVAIDEFGSGYSNHADLQRLPVDFLNVDRRALAASDDDDYRSWLLQTILVLGRDLSLTVIAKGIETAEQLGAVQEMGCTMVQGALLGKPMPASDVEGVFGTTLAVERPASSSPLH